MHSQTGGEVMRVTSTPQFLSEDKKIKIKIKNIKQKTDIFDTDISLFGQKPHCHWQKCAFPKKKKKSKPESIFSVFLVINSAFFHKTHKKYI